MKDKNNWITQGVKISWKHKRSLCAFSKNSSNPKAKAHYTKHCKILRKVIKDAKKQHYTGLMIKPINRIKSTWYIIKKETGTVHSVEQVPTLVLLLFVLVVRPISTAAMKAYCTLTPMELRHSSPEALHNKRRERPLLAKDGTKAEKFS
jgi:hypothetical protein